MSLPALILSIFVAHPPAYGQPIPANQVQGSMHGFLLLKEADGKTIAVGDVIQVAHGRQVRSRMVFRFRDGSLDDDTTVFLQGRVLTLVSDHHIQRGPSFPKPLDLMINVPTSEAMWKQTKEGREEIKTEHMDFPDDLANGLVPLVLSNIAPKMEETTVSYLVGSPKPRIVRLSIKPQGVERYRLAGVARQAKKYNIHIELGGFVGFVAPVIGKQPHDLKIWVADGEVPTVVKTVGELYEGGPIWTMEQTSPTWPQSFSGSIYAK